MLWGLQMPLKNKVKTSLSAFSFSFHLRTNSKIYQIAKPFGTFYYVQTCLTCFVKGPQQNLKQFCQINTNNSYK